MENSGAFIHNNRVNGILSVSRAFGDFRFKRDNGVICVPEIRFDKIKFLEDDFIVIATDGIFDQHSNSFVGDYIYEKFCEDKQFLPQDIAYKLICDVNDRNMKNINYSDNLSLMIIFLNRGYNRDKEELL